MVDNNELKEIIKECYIEIKEEEYMEEGANLDSLNIYSVLALEFTSNMDSLKNELKNNNFKEAKLKIDNMQHITEKAEKEIRDLDQDKISKNFGNLTYFTGIVLYSLVPLFELIMKVKIKNFFNKKETTSLRDETSSKLKKIGLSFKFTKNIITLTTDIMETNEIIKREYKSAKTEEEKEKCANRFRAFLLKNIERFKIELAKMKGLVDYKESEYAKLNKKE